MMPMGWIRAHLRWSTAAIAIVVTVLAGAAAGATTDYGVAIDAAGRQRMLTQRIVKAYCQVGMRVTPEVSKAQLDAAVRRFDRQLLDLAKVVPNAESRDALARLRMQWRDFRRLAIGPVSRAGARRLAAQSDGVLQAAHQLVLLLQDAAGTPQARLVNLAGRQRMLSQRLAKLYMLRAYGVDTPSLRDELESTRNEFEGALASLRAAPENTGAIELELDAVALQWEWFKNALALQGTDSYVLVVGDASESILNSMDLITARYAALVSR
jgi:hypothetical protein